MGNNHNRKRKKKKNFIVDNKIKILVALLLVIVAIALTAAGAAYAVIRAYIEELPEMDLDLLIPSQTSSLYDMHENHWVDVYSAENRIQVPLHTVPQHVQDAFIAIEDERFYEHSGIDLKAIGRAFISNIQRQRIAQGGSTITQQLVKNAFLTPDRDYKRKIQEAYLAFQLERVFHKEEILEYYLNWIYFDYSTNGVEAASQMFFRKSVGELTIAEAALLAAVPNNPSLYSPYRSMEGPFPTTLTEDSLTRNRQLVILGKMRELEMLTEWEYQRARAEQVALFDPPTRDTPYFHFYEYLIHHELKSLFTKIPELADKHYSQTLYGGGLRIYTTLDPELQEFVDEVVNNPDNYPTTVENAKGHTNPQANVVLAEPETGYIRVLQGGRDAGRDNQLLRFGPEVRRDTGSAIKPIIAYAPALEAGVITAATPIDDAPVEYRQYDNFRPENFHRVFYGLLNMRRAMAMSYNVSAVKVFDDLGPSVGVEYAKRFGLESLVDPPGVLVGNKRAHDHVIAATLGGLTRGVTTLEMTQSFAVLANGGLRLDLTTVTRIEDSAGRVLYQHQPEPVRVVSEETAYIMTHMLFDTVRSGTGAQLRLDRPLAAKTGTSQNRRTGYLVAYTRDYVMGYWLGHDIPLDGEIRSPWNHAPKFFNPILRRAHEGLPVRNFTRPSSIVSASVCVKSGLRPGPYCPEEHIVSEIFVRGTAPTEECDLHYPMLLCSVSGLLPGEYCPEHLLEEMIVFDRPEYITTTRDWAAGEGRTPPDIEDMPPEETCDVHTDRPQAPQNLSYTISNGSVTLQWAKPGGMKIEGYLVFRQLQGESDFLQLTEEPIKLTSYTDDTVREERTYIYQVIAVSDQGTLSQTASITVEVPKKVYTLTMQKEGQGTVEPSEGSHTYPDGTTVSVKATPASGWNFVEWKGDVKNNGNAETEVEIDKDKTITAVFEKTLAQFTLTISKEGGNGNCKVEPFTGSRTFDEGSRVTLKASVTGNASYEFDRWVINDSPQEQGKESITITINRDTNAVAHFKEKEEEGETETSFNWFNFFNRFLAFLY